MAKLFYYHDTRSGKDTFPLKIRISHNKGNAYIGLGIRISPEQWDAESGMVVGHEKAKTYNARIRSEMSNAEQIISKLELSGEIKKYSATQVKEIIENDGELPDGKSGAGQDITSSLSLLTSSCVQFYHLVLSLFQGSRPLFSLLGRSQISLLWTGGRIGSAEELWKLCKVFCNICCTNEILSLYLKSKILTSTS